MHLQPNTNKPLDLKPEKKESELKVICSNQLQLLKSVGGLLEKTYFYLKSITD